MDAEFTTGGLVFMICSWGAITGLCAFCFYKVFKKQAGDKPFTSSFCHFMLPNTLLKCKWQHYFYVVQYFSEVRSPQMLPKSVFLLFQQHKYDTKLSISEQNRLIYLQFILPNHLFFDMWQHFSAIFTIFVFFPAPNKACDRFASTSFQPLKGLLKFAIFSSSFLLTFYFKRTIFTTLENAFTKEKLTRLQVL